MNRPSGRDLNELRAVSLECNYTRHAEGSVLVSFGDTKVLCNASVESRLPPWLRNKDQGWITAEYGMLPRATNTRNMREAAKGKQQGRTMEIQRLIARSLRAVANLEAIPGYQITVDCDVLQADGGTRTAAITGAYVALAQALKPLENSGKTRGPVLLGHVAAVSVGIYQGVPVLDLDYAEDSNAETDFNIVMNDGGGFIEVQGTAEGNAFHRNELDAMLDLARDGINSLVAHQRDALNGA